MRMTSIVFLGWVFLLSCESLAQLQSPQGTEPTRRIERVIGSGRSHLLTPGSRGNDLALQLCAGPQAFLSDSLFVCLLTTGRVPGESTLGSVTVRPLSRVVSSPISGGTSEVHFALDVVPEPHIDKADTIEFIVYGRAGALVQKQIILTFSLPHQYELSQNYPNPFNPSTTINYQLPYSSRVNLTVYDLLGRQVKILVDEMRDAGYHQGVFDASGLASGVYIYRLQATGNGSYHQVKRMLLLK
jgi:hypothetical protein